MIILLGFYFLSSLNGVQRPIKCFFTKNKKHACFNFCFFKGNDVFSFSCFVKRASVTGPLLSMSVFQPCLLGNCCMNHCSTLSLSVSPMQNLCRFQQGQRKPPSSSHELHRFITNTLSFRLSFIFTAVLLLD